MLEFLISLLLFVFGLGSVDHPAFDPETIISRIEEHITDVQAPEGDPENGPDLPDQAQNSNQEPQNENNQANHDGNGENQENAVEPDTTKVRAYNISSEKIIQRVAAVAVENAPPLEDCADHPEECDPEPEPQADPTPTIPIPLPTPIILPISNPCLNHPDLPDNPKIMAPQLYCPETL